MLNYRCVLYWKNCEPTTVNREWEILYEDSGMQGCEKDI